MNRSKVILCLALFIGTILRLVLLGHTPAGFTPDESSQAYSAYSLLKTGRDEWGISWPVSSFKSFLDYKAPLQTYLMIPSVALFGLNEFATRLPSAVFGILAIFSLYLLCKELFPKSIYLPSIAALLLSISPWHLQFSRMALEVNLTSFLFPLGLYFFLRGLKDSHFYIWTAFLWGISLYAYHSARIFVPLFAIGTLILFRKKIFSRGLKPLIVPAIVIFVLITPITVDFLWGNGAKRGNDLLITNLSGEKIKEIKDEVSFSDLSKISPKISKIFHNSTVSIITQFSENYLSYFSLPFWFTESGNETTYSVIPGRGLLYFWMLPLVLVGLFLILKKPKDIDYDAQILLLWLVIAAIPAALTKEGYRPNRAGSFLCLWEIVAAFGFVNLLKINFPHRKILLSVFTVFSLVLTGYYFEDYFLNTKVTYPRSLSFGWREAVTYIKSVEENYKSVMIEQGTQGQTFVAFYLRMEPQQFQESAKVWDEQIRQNHTNYLDQIAIYKLGKYSFETLNWPEDVNADTLYLTQNNNRDLLPKNRRTLHEVKTPTGEIIMEVFDFRK